MYEQGIVRPDGDQVVAFDPAARVQHHDHEALALGIVIAVVCDRLPPISGGLVRRVAHRRIDRALAQGDHLKFLGVKLERRFPGNTWHFQERLLIVHKKRLAVARQLRLAGWANAGPGWMRMETRN